MNIKHLGIFIENYAAGGSDLMAAIYALNIPANKTTIILNARNDLSILEEKIKGKPDINLYFYHLITLAELGAFANSFRDKSLFIYFILKCFNLLIRYPLLFLSIFYFKAIFKKLGVTFLLVNNGGYPGGAYTQMASIAYKNNLHIIHSKPTAALLGILKPIEFYIDNLIDRNSKIMCVSNENKNTLLKLRNFKQDIEVIETGIKIPPKCLSNLSPPCHEYCINYYINCARFKTYKSGETLRLLNVGTLYSIKNQMLILKALGELRLEGHENVTLHIVGKEGEEGYKDRLMSYAEELGIENNIFLEGFKDPLHYYNFCHVFVLSSLVEGGPIVTLEAMSYYMPIVMSKVGAYEKQINEYYNGLLYNSSEINILKSHIRYFLNNANEVERMGINARKMVEEHFSFNVMMEKYIKVIHEVTNQS